MSQLSQLDGASSQSNQDRRRSEPRTLCDRTISLLSCNQTDKPMQAQMSDCSPNGLGLFLPTNVPAGQQVLVKVQLAGEPALMMYTIRYCIPTSANQFRAGARFTGFAANKVDGKGDSIVASLTRG